MLYTDYKQPSDYNVGAANLELMKEILDVDWELILGPLDISDSWKCFKTIYQDAIDRCVPVHKPKIKKNLWVNSDALQLKRNKNKLWKKFRVTGSPSNLLNYKTVNNQLRQLIHNLRKQYEKDLAMNIGSKLKAFWKYINSRIKTCPTIDELHRSDGSFTSLHSEIVNMFNGYFSSVFTREDNFIPKPHTD